MQFVKRPRFFVCESIVKTQNLNAKSAGRKEIKVCDKRST